MPEACHDGHTATVQRLARALASVFQGENPTDEQASWFVDDAERIAADTDERAGWLVERLPDLPGGQDHFAVNGTAWWIDPNEEGPGSPQPISAFDPEDYEPGDSGGSRKST